MPAAKKKSSAMLKRGDLLPAEIRVRKLQAEIKIAQLKQAKAQLSTYAAAETSRRTRDWKANNSSADLAIIPDSLTLLGRARQLERDAWAAKSIKRAFTRNVVGKGITVIPHAKDKDGKPLAKLNAIAQREFTKWATSKFCDVERRQTFGQKQRLAADERCVAGEHVWHWSYQPPINVRGMVDKSRPVGLALQSFEPEQFDLRIQSYGDREVRGGVEVDENGAPIAYHLYTRNPNDVLYRHAFFSSRIPASRIFHYFKSERVLQTRGVGMLTPVMKDIRNLERIQDATLTRVLMEACIGLVLEMNMTVPNANGPVTMGQPSAPSYDSITEADFMPGMVARTAPGESVKTVQPTSPGNTYDPFVTLTTRGIGAGVGMSFGQVMRHSDGNYSSARQDMLEDQREWGPEQDLLKDDLLKPTYELWFSFAVQEGRFDDCDEFNEAEYYADQSRFSEADYIPPAQSWIDPEKEAKAFEILLQNKLITREEIVAMRGGRWLQTMHKSASEAEEAANEGIMFPEGKDQRTNMMELLKAMLSNRLGAIDNTTFNTMDSMDIFNALGIGRRKNYSVPLLPVVIAAGQEITGDPVKNKAGEVIAGGLTPPPAPPAADPNAPPTPGGHINGPHGEFVHNPATPAKTTAPVAKLSVGVGLPVLQPPRNVPKYRPAMIDAISCGTCSFIMGDLCTKYAFQTRSSYRCDSWLAETLTEAIGVPQGGKTFPLGPQPGQKDMESDFYPDADPTQRPGD